MKRISKKKWCTLTFEKILLRNIELPGIDNVVSFFETIVAVAVVVDDDVAVDIESFSSS